MKKATDDCLDVLLALLEGQRSAGPRREAARWAIENPTRYETLYQDWKQAFIDLIKESPELIEIMRNNPYDPRLQQFNKRLDALIFHYEPLEENNATGAIIMAVAAEASPS